MRDGGFGSRCVVALACIVFFGVLAYGQGSPTASLSGVVSDQTGAVIPGADVSVKNVATGLESKTVTVENGTYSVPALDPGTYVVTVTLPGFKQAVVNNVKIDAGVPATVRVTLEVGNATETVEVFGGGAETLQYETATVAARSKLRRCPTCRSFRGTL